MTNTSYTSISRVYVDREIGDIPAAPRTATFLSALAELEKPRARRPVDRATDRENIFSLCI